jgi:hypothetical protein
MTRGSLFASILFYTAAVVVFAQTSEGDWVPYTASYTETVVNPGQAPKTYQSIVSRSSDGSELDIVVGDGRTMGKLWDASGDHYALDFINKHAVYQNNTQPKTHAPIPAPAPLRSEVISGISCSVYPIGIQNGTGTLCVDTARDILVREEIQMAESGGLMSLVRELRTIDFSKPGPSEKVGVPPGFQTLKP